MSIVPVNVPVPTSGDGPIVDVSDIVGPKTVQLSGQFEGYYVLLASQDDVDFVGVSLFDTSSPTGLRVTFSGSVKSLRLRACATTSGLVTCEVSGISGPGENGFGVVATLPGGFTGPTPVVDLATFVPPTGPEEDTCFICRGAFRGPINVLGSVDGSRYEPLGMFRVDRIPEGAPAVAELAPLVTDVKIRYAKLYVLGITTGPVVVTVGGRVPSSSYYTGATGATGATGPAGATGATGTAGDPGGAGATGATGVAGTAGNTGATGATGVAGTAGGTGATGATGVAGTSGGTGATGATGVVGTAGGTGATGATGVAGTSGGTGATGATGVAGTAGGTGATGATGVAGTAGPAGATGATGTAGDPGGAGATGATGVAGTAGNTGATGATGVAGTAGGTGATGATGVAGTAGGTGATGATGASGTNILFTAKGDLLSFDGATATVVPVGVSAGMVPIVSPGSPVAWSWNALPTGSLAGAGILQLGTVGGTACAGNDPRLGNPAYSGRLVIPTRNSTTSSRSKDGGNTWIAGAALTNGGWYGCVWDPIHGRFVTISNGATLTGGCNYSVDGGATWTTGNVLSNSITSWFKVFYDPGHGTLFAVPQSQTSGAVYSTDGGTTWNISASTLVNAVWWDAGYDTTRNRWVMVSQASTDTMYTTDGGVTWTAGGATANGMGSIAYDPLRDRLVVLPLNPNSTCQYSSDGGVTWANGATGLTTGGSYFGQVWDPVHRKLVMMDDVHTQTYYSINGGSTWLAGGSVASACTVRQMTYDAVSGLIWVASSATTTLYSSENGGLTWVASTAPNTCGPILGVATP